METISENLNCSAEINRSWGGQSQQVHLHHSSRIYVSGSRLEGETERLQEAEYHHVCCETALCTDWLLWSVHWVQLRFSVMVSTCCRVRLLWRGLQLHYMLYICVCVHIQIYAYTHIHNNNQRKQAINVKVGGYGRGWRGEGKWSHYILIKMYFKIILFRSLALLHLYSVTLGRPSLCVRWVINENLAVTSQQAQILNIRSYNCAGALWHGREETWHELPC